MIILFNPILLLIVLLMILMNKLIIYKFNQFKKLEFIRKNKKSIYIIDKKLILYIVNKFGIIILEIL